MASNGILFLDNDFLKNFLQAAGCYGRLASDPDAQNAQIAQGVDALDELEAWAKTNGLTLQITDVVAGEAITQPKAYAPDAAIQAWIEQGEIDPISTPIGESIDNGTVPSNFPDKGEISITQAAKEPISQGINVQVGTDDKSFTGWDEAGISPNNIVRSPGFIDQNFAFDTETGTLTFDPTATQAGELTPSGTGGELVPESDVLSASPPSAELQSFANETTTTPGGITELETAIGQGGTALETISAVAKGAAVIGGVFAIYDITTSFAKAATDLQNGNTQDAEYTLSGLGARLSLGLAGGEAAGAAGAALGTFLGPVGTAVGGIVGALIGGATGALDGQAAVDYLYGKQNAVLQGP